MTPLPHSGLDTGPDTGVVPVPCDPVLALRLRPPTPPVHAIERTALRALLATHPRARLLLFCAPAGFGKTTAMATHLAACRAAQQPALTAWITLDEADNDVERLLAKLHAAASGLRQARELPEPSGAVERLRNGLTLLHRMAGSRHRLVCCLDDVEVLRNPTALDLLHQLLAHWPAHGQLVIGSREQPPLNLSALRSAGQLLEVGPEQLRLSLAESQTLLRRHGRPLSSATIARLHERTEGWVTALQLAALALQHHPAPEQFAAAFSGSHSTVADYLLESVLAGLPPLLRDFALQVSLLDEFDAEMARAVTGHDDAAGLIDTLQRQNLFIAPLDDAQQRFRFHALFATFLRAEVARRQPARVVAVHRAASQWRLAQGRVVPAIHHALASGDTELALDLLQAHAEKLLLQGRFRLLARWFERLGPARCSQRPMLVPFHACALALTRRQPEALRLLDALESDTQEAAAPTPVDRDWIGAVRGLAHAMLDQSEACLEVSLRHHRPDDGNPTGSAHGMLANALANALLTATRFDEAMAVLTTAKRWHWRTGSHFNMTVAECVHANLELVQGRLQDAQTRLQTTLSARGHAAVQSLGGSAALGVGLATALYARNELPAAQRLLLDSLPFTKEAGPPDTLLLNHLLLARCAHAAGDTEQTLQRLAEMERIGHSAGLERLVATAWLERARLALLDDQPERAADYLDQAAAHPDVWQQLQRFPANANDVDDLALARLRWQVRAGAAAAAIVPLRQAVRDADAARRRVRAALLRLLLAEAMLADGQTRTALRQASDVVEWCCVSGHQRLLIDEGRPVLPLLQGVAAGSLPGQLGGLAAFMEPVLTACGMAAAPASLGGAVADGTQPGAATEQDLLSERELVVLQQLAQGHSNREIGARLFIAENTVKAHLRSLNAKLGASNRTQAVANARRRGLLAQR